MIIRTCIMLFVAFLFATPAMAAIEKTSASATMIAQQNNKLKKNFKIEKRQEMIQKSLKKSGFKDPFLWLWLSSWILGGLFYFIALLGGHASNTIYSILGRLSVVAVIIGAVFLLIWIVKKIA
jgi:Flp pilus assembly protein TadB